MTGLLLKARGLLQPDSALRASLWLILLALVASTKTDPDLWGHVRFGMDIIRDMAIRQTDSYSFTSDRDWVNHEWAAEVLSGMSYLAAGNAGLVLLKLLVVCGVLLLLNAALRWDGVTEARQRDLVIVAAVITTIQQTLHVRPQLFSLLFFAGLLLCLQLALRDRRYLLAVPVIFGLWANFHGGWIVGGGVLIVWTLGVALSKDAGIRTAVHYSAAGAAALAATLINPAGLGLLTFLQGTVGFGRADIVDWQPVYVLGPAVWGLWALTAALAAFGLAQSWRGRPQLERVLVVLVLAVGSFQVNRLLAFFALATLFLFGAAIAASFSRKQRIRVARPRGAAALVAVTLAIVLSAGALRALAINATCVRVDEPATPEPGAVDFFKAQGTRGRLLVWFDWGQYALWHLAPELRVSIDGRRETVYSDRVQNRHLRFYFDAPGGATLPEEIAADYIWIPKYLPAAQRLTAEGWTPVYAGDQSLIFSRTAVPPTTAPIPSIDVGSRCFPNR